MVTINSTILGMKKQLFLRSKTVISTNIETGNHTGIVTYSIKTRRNSFSTRFKTKTKEIIVSQFNRIFEDNNYFECDKCGSLATIDKNGKLMRMITNIQGLPVIYEEKNKESFIDENGNLKCDCSD